jgi:cytidylate kinase
MPEARPFLVAVDGGAASGKSSTARALAQRFGLLHVDTGSFYRFVTQRLLETGVSPDDEPGVRAALEHLRPGVRIEGLEARMELGGEVPGPGIRSEAVNRSVSAFAALPCVRSFLLDYQRSFPAAASRAGLAGIVMEGRDIGSVILPGADLRVFLTADPEARARRRAVQGETDRIAERDRRDSSRSTAPLVCPPGAFVVDSTHLTLEQVVEKVAAEVESRLASRA